MVQWIAFVLLTPFSYLATFCFGVLASTALKGILLKDKRTFLLSGTGFGVLIMFVLCYLTPFFSRNILFVLGGGGMGFAVALLFSITAGIPQTENQISGIA